MENNAYIVVQNVWDGDYEDSWNMFVSLSLDEARKEMMRRFIIHYAEAVHLYSRFKEADEVRKTVGCDLDECTTYPDRGAFFHIFVESMELGKVNMDF